MAAPPEVRAEEPKIGSFDVPACTTCPAPVALFLSPTDNNPTTPATTVPSDMIGATPPSPLSGPNLVQTTITWSPIQQTWAPQQPRRTFDTNSRQENSFSNSPTRQSQEKFQFVYDISDYFSPLPRTSVDGMNRTMQFSPVHDNQNNTLHNNEFITENLQPLSVDERLNNVFASIKENEFSLFQFFLATIDSKDSQVVQAVNRFYADDGPAKIVSKWGAHLKSKKRYDEEFQRAVAAVAVN
ncbi:MAG: hypothetical protein BYD32DRAFT_457683 [Podila humilis]|nr:MAG: hypothetical protein BYD32DRAFT_457683 [Podila humilis]